MISIIVDRCVGCSLCVPICNENALSCYGVVAVTNTCTDCLECVDFCPKGALQASDQRGDTRDAEGQHPSSPSPNPVKSGV